MEIFSSFKKCKTVAIVFNSTYNKEALYLYDCMSKLYPQVTFFLINCKEIICPLKVKNSFCGFVTVGPDCPMHKFDVKCVIKLNNVLWSKPDGSSISIKENDTIGSVIGTQISHLRILKEQNPEDGWEKYFPSNTTKTTPTDDNLQDVVMERKNGDVVILAMSVNLLNPLTKDVQALYDPLLMKISTDEKYDTERMKFFMKENINAKHFADKTVFAIIFTHTSYNKEAEEIYQVLRKYKSNVYKLFLKDVSYERLISIDSVDCIVLVDCPLFECNIDLHIPVVSVFSICRGIDQKWTGEGWKRNKTQLNAISLDEEISKERSLTIRDTKVAKIIGGRDFQGVTYKNEEEDDDMYEGRKGVANDYEEEGGK